MLFPRRDVLVKLFPVLTKNNYMLYAAWKYGRGTWTDFFSDMKILTKFMRNLNPKDDTRYILNMFIYFSNIFPQESFSRIMFFMADTENEKTVKTILSFLYRLPDSIPDRDIRGIPYDTDLMFRLKNI